jgi:lipoate-protein ligase A
LARALRLHRDSFPDDPALDTAVSRAILDRVAAGELPETARIGRPGPMVAFGRQDVASRLYAAAARAAREGGFEAVERLAGGRAAVFHEGTLAFAHATAENEPQAGIYARFEATAELMTVAFRRLGVDARMGEVPGEYCPGGYSVNAGGRTKLAGIGQKLIKGAAHLGGVLVVRDSERIRRVLVPVYRALGLEWDPATAGSVEDETGERSLDALEAALLEELSARYELEELPLDDETLALARRLAPQHRSPG